MREMKHVTAIALAGIGLIAAGAGHAATITGWNTENVVKAPPTVLPDDDGVTGFSAVYDRPVINNVAAPDAVTSGRISFTPPEAVSPGIQVEPETYTQGDSDGITLDGCLMTSNPNANCTSEFQSGKRIKQQMTGLGPVDLVFDVDSNGDDSNYQVFHRLINLTKQSLSGFSIELGFGIGDNFTQAGDESGISFASGFRAQPTGSGAASTQFPFGLFGDASDNINFDLDGFFAAERTGYNVDFSAVKLTSTGMFGPYENLFGDWKSQESVPTGAFWDNDNDPGTDALVMAWLNEDGQWEIRREVIDATAGTAGALVTPELRDTLQEVVEFLGLDAALITTGPIEDLANLNVNFAINLNDLLLFGDDDTFKTASFTLRTTVFAAATAPVPLPAGAPLLIGGLGMLWALRRRRQSLA